MCGFQHTNQTEPNKLKSENRNDTQSNPTDRLRVQCQPEESLIRSIDMSGFRVRRLKDPIAVAWLYVDFIPPAEAHQSPAGDVFEVVKVHCEKYDCDDEDEDVVFDEEEAEEVDEETGCGKRT